MAKTKEGRANESTDVRRAEENDSRKGEQRNQAMTRRGHEMRQRHSPFEFMRRFNEEMDRLFQDFGSNREFPETSFGREFGVFGNHGLSIWAPQIELFESKGELCIRADLPGMTKDDIDVEIMDNTLVLRGERRSDRDEQEEDQGYYHTERSYGSFYRTILLPEGVDAEKAEANIRHGVLEITIPAPERAGKRRLEIGEGEEERPRARTKAAGQQ